MSWLCPLPMPWKEHSVVVGILDMAVLQEPPGLLVLMAVAVSAQTSYLDRPTRHHAHIDN